MIPEGWYKATLGEGAIHVGRGTAPQYAAGASCVYAINQKCVRHGRVAREHARAHEQDVEVKSDSILRAGDVCVNSTGTGTIGRVGLWNDDGGSGTFFADTHVTIVRPDSKRIVSRFLSENLLSESIQREMEMVCFSGSTNQVELNKTAFSQLTFLIPPLGEQRKIAAILSSVDDAIWATHAVIGQLQAVKQAMMAELLTRGLPGRHKRFKQTEIGEIPEEWTVGTYSELAAKVPRAIQSGPFGSALRHDEFTREGAFVVGIDNVQDGYFSPGSEHRIKPTKFDELRKFELRPLDLLIVVTGASTGRACVFPAGWETSILTKHVYRMTVDSSRADAYYLLACLRYLPAVVRRVRGIAQGLSRPGLNKELLMPVAFPLPSLGEQTAISRAAGALDVRVESERAVLASLQEVKSALSSRLLTGELRVTPDPEPV